ncbi:uroporphyrinogen-III synthase [Sphingorhabdus sp. EL138]|uniref:uroporphyrinogen-III synthase n=1 Tax=Sphingorhabdus sp. EL138 TaxID=2073156 RepID=UPI0025E4FCB6|nr:uroporphyrinogen-III synthase [Sphingorhabdus sp. EL138]
MKLLIIRPQPGADATAHRLRAAGHAPILMPLFAIEHLPAQRVSADGYDAILLTSGNAARAAVEFLSQDHAKPIYAVGSATASALQILSLPVAQTGSEGVDALVRRAVADGHQRLLWLAGEDHSPIAPIDGVRIDIEIVYRSAAVSVPDDFVRHVTESDVVILHSSRAAQHFAELCASISLPRAAVTLATFSNAIAKAAGENWGGMIIAQAPNDAALLKAIQGQFTLPYCQDERGAAIEGPI